MKRFRNTNWWAAHSERSLCVVADEPDRALLAMLQWAGWNLFLRAVDAQSPLPGEVRVAVVIVRDPQVASRAVAQLRNLAPAVPRVLVLQDVDRPWFEASVHARDIVWREDSEGLLRAVAIAAGEPCAPPFELLESMLGTEVRLPVFPTTLVALDEALSRPASSADDIEAVLVRDPALAAATLRLANSGYFMLSRRVSSLRRAVALLGTSCVRALALAAGCFDTEARAYRVAALARREGVARTLLVRQILGGHAERALSGAVLAGAGMVVLEQALGAQYTALLDEAKATGTPRRLLERRALGVTHLEVTASVLDAWNFPPHIVRSVAQIDDRFPAPNRGLDERSALYLATAIAEENDTSSTSELLPPAWLRAVGVDHLVDRWRHEAADLAICQIAA